MRAEKLEIENFRGMYGEHSIRFAPKLAVLVGVNGAGKSAVLDALAANLSGVASLIAGGRTAWFGAGEAANVSAGEDVAFWFVHLNNRADERTLLGHMAGDDPDWKGADLDERPFGFLHTLGDQTTDLDKPLPFLAYLHSGSTRAPASHPPRAVTMTGRLEAFKGAFDSESIQFDALESWFEQEENLENQRIIEEQKLKFQLPSLRAVRKAVRVFLEELHGSGLGKIRVVRVHSNGQLAPARGRLVVEKADTPLFLNQLSDGERRLVLLVADTARRMVILNPTMKDPLKTEGILLIDEIELHLHPLWQRRVIPALQAAFPELQLIVSTHAPAVLSGVPNESIIVLEDGKVLEGTPRAFGLDANSILAGVMKTPILPDDVQRDVDEVYRLVDSDPDRAGDAIDALGKKVGADHPELVRARGLLAFMAG